MTDQELLLIAFGALKQIADHAVEPGSDPMAAVIDMQTVATNAIHSIAGIPPEARQRPILTVVK
jgi:hypothetical protein